MFKTSPMSIRISPVTIMYSDYPNSRLTKHSYSGREMTSLIPFTLLSRRIWLLCGSGHSASAVSKVTTPFLTVRSMSAGSRRSNGFAETAARTLTSVNRSGIVRVLRWSMARRMNFTQRRRSSRFAQAAEATAATQIGRILRAIGRGIMYNSYTPSRANSDPRRGGIAQVWFVGLSVI